jgi:hypothetical protein
VANGRGLPFNGPAYAGPFPCSAITTVAMEISKALTARMITTTSGRRRFLRPGTGTTSLCRCRPAGHREEKRAAVPSMDPHTRKPELRLQNTRSQACPSWLIFAVRGIGSDQAARETYMVKKLLTIGIIVVVILFIVRPDSATTVAAQHAGGWVASLGRQRGWMRWGSGRGWRHLPAPIVTGRPTSRFPSVVGATLGAIAGHSG